ncbi:MAG: GntR family transcriptional regulator [Pseudomonadota bacterium]
MTRVADQLIETLKNEIHTGVLKPGDQLEEAALAQRFDVSRTPVREAVRSLVECGLLETRSRKGAFVRELSAKEILDLFEVAAELEGLACRLAAERLTAETTQTIEDGLAACQKAANAEDPVAYAHANLAFHTAIHMGSGNDRLIEQLSELETRINPYRSMPYRMRNRLAQSTQEHLEIMTAILAGDGARASDLMRSHMMLQGQRLPIILQNLK